MQTPPTTGLLLDDGDALFELGGLDGGAVSSGTGADHDQIVVVVGHGDTSWRSDSGHEPRLTNPHRARNHENCETTKRGTIQVARGFVFSWFRVILTGIVR